MKIETLDLEFGNTPRTIGSFLITGKQSPVLIESGPGSTLATLVARLDERGIKPKDVGHLLLTHIHLDHAGAAGWWAQQGTRVYVHPVETSGQRGADLRRPAGRTVGRDPPGAERSGGRRRRR